MSQNSTNFKYLIQNHFGKLVVPHFGQRSGGGEENCYLHELDDRHVTRGKIPNGLLRWDRFTTENSMYRCVHLLIYPCDIHK